MVHVHCPNEALHHGLSGNPWMARRATSIVFATMVGSMPCESRFQTGSAALRAAKLRALNWSLFLSGEQHLCLAARHTFFKQVRHLVQRRELSMRPRRLPRRMSTRGQVKCSNCVETATRLPICSFKRATRHLLRKAKLEAHWARIFTFQVSWETRGWQSALWRDFNVQMVLWFNLSPSLFLRWAEHRGHCQVTGTWVVFSPRANWAWAERLRSSHGASKWHAFMWWLFCSVTCRALVACATNGQWGHVHRKQPGLAVKDEPRDRNALFGGDGCSSCSQSIRKVCHFGICSTEWSRRNTDLPVGGGPVAGRPRGKVSQGRCNTLAASGSFGLNDTLTLAGLESSTRGSKIRQTWTHNTTPHLGVLWLGTLLIQELEAFLQFCFVDLLDELIVSSTMVFETHKIVGTLRIQQVKVPIVSAYPQPVS